MMTKLKIKAIIIFFIALLAGLALIKNPFHNPYKYRHVLILEPFRPRIIIPKHIDQQKNDTNAKH